MVASQSNVIIVFLVFLVIIIFFFPVPFLAPRCLRDGSIRVRANSKVLVKGLRPRPVPKRGRGEAEVHPACQPS